MTTMYQHIVGKDAYNSRGLLLERFDETSAQIEQLLLEQIKELAPITRQIYSIKATLSRVGNETIFRVEIEDELK